MERELLHEALQGAVGAELVKTRVPLGKGNLTS